MRLRVGFKDVPSIAMQRTTFSPRCCYRLVSNLGAGTSRLGHGVTYGNLEHELLVVVGGLEGVQNRGQLGSVEFDCSEG